MSPCKFFGVSRLSQPVSFSLLSIQEELKSAWRISGGDDGVRTHDPLLAGQVLSQLSYTPVSTGLFFFNDHNNSWVVSDP